MNKKISRIITTIIIIVTILCAFPKYTKASTEDVVGIIFSPARWLVCGLGDAVMNVGQTIICGSKAIDDGIINFQLTPEAIFSNKIELLDVNFFSPKSAESTAGQISATLASWYIVLRNIGLVGLLSVLAYMGLKIILSSLAEEKAKFNQMLMDWLISLILIFFMHYIMSFCISITNTITQSIATSSSQGIMSEVRLEISNNVNEDKLYKAMGYTIIYGVLIIYTFMFLFKYLRRVINIAFLTVIAPLVAFTYPIDKMGDGKAQAIGVWFKEYITNLILQPMHLIIYTVLMGTVTDLAGTHLFYALVALGFMAEGEQIIRKFFGIGSESADNGSFVGGAMVANAINSITKRAGKTVKKGGKVGSKQEEEKNSNVRYARSTDDSFDEKDYMLSTIKNQEEQTNKKEANKQEENIEKMGTQIRKELLNANVKEQKDNYKEGNKSEEIRTKQNTNKENKNKRKINNKLRAAGNIGKRYVLKGAGKVARTYIAANAAMALGTIGIAAGLASDDYSNVFKYGSAAMTGGAIIANSTIDKAKNIPSSVMEIKDNIQDEYLKNLYEDDPKGLKAYTNKKSDEEFLKNKEIKKLYKSEYGKDANKAMQAALEYRKRGITDDETIIKAMNLQDAGENYADDRKIWAAIAANKSKDLDKLEERLIKKNGQDPKEVEKLINLARKVKGEL